MLKYSTRTLLRPKKVFDMQPYSAAILANSTQQSLLGNLSTTTNKIMAQVKTSPLWFAIDRYILWFYWFQWFY